MQAGPTDGGQHVAGSGAKRPRVALDLTTLGQCGRPPTADLPQVRFVHELIRRAGDVDFLLMSGPATIGALATIELRNASRVQVPSPSPVESILARASSRAIRRLQRSRLGVSQSWTLRLGPALRGWRRGLPARLGANVVFCPFTSSGVTDPAVPLVAGVHDLQHLSHPYLLTPTQRALRARRVDPGCRRADRIVCTTSSLREVALNSYGRSAQHVLSIGPGPLLTPKAAPGAATGTTNVLARLGLQQAGYYLVASDFEPRQNHALVLTALGMVCARLPDDGLRLVFAGQPNERTDEVRSAAKRMGLGGVISFVDENLTALIQGCRAVIVPSLYETIGEIPLEAMDLGRPVICSDVPDLAQLVDGAALLFDAHAPAELANAFERMQREPLLAERLAELGKQRLARLETAESVAQAYVSVLREAARPAGTRRS